MKYGNYLIVTLPDFRRHFDFNTFYRNRYQFVTDMHPDKVYYWDNAKLVSAYYIVSDWLLNNNDIVNEDIPQDVIDALQSLTGKTLSVPGFRTNKIDLSEEIIALTPGPGQNYSLPVFDCAKRPDKIDIHLHKLVVSEESEIPCIISAGEQTREMHFGDVLYVTECDGKFLDFSSNFEETEFLTGQLIDSPGSKGSILVITDKANGIKQHISGVIDFILVDKGYIYINERGQLVTIDNNVPMVLLRINKSRAVQIKSKENSIAVLYHNGLCKSTTSMTPVQNVIKI